MSEKLYTCYGKGGRYRKIAHAKAAGAMKSVKDEVVVYQCVHTGAFYFRSIEDWSDRMFEIFD